MACAAEQRRFLLDVVTRIEVQQDRVRIILRTDALRGILGKTRANDENGENGAQGKGDFKLYIPVSFKRRGIEMKLVVTSDQGPVRDPDLKLISASLGDMVGLLSSGTEMRGRWVSLLSATASTKATSAG